MKWLTCSVETMTPALGLGHILRLLATHHITREVAPNVFANNRISSMLDTGKDPHDLITRCALAKRKYGSADTARSPQGKYDDTNGIAAFVGLWCVAGIA